MAQRLTLRRAEEIGDKAAADYIRSRPAEACFDVEGFAEEVLGLSIAYERFSGRDSDLIGFLSNGRDPVRVRRNGRDIDVIFARDTAVIADGLRRRERNGRRRFTIAHEAAHRMLEMEMLRDISDRDMACGMDVTSPEGVRAVRRILSADEDLTDRLASALLMPRELVERAAREANAGSGVTLYADGAMTDEHITVLETMAGRLQVSRSAMFARLRELRMMEYMPSYRYRTLGNTARREWMGKTRNCSDIPQETAEKLRRSEEEVEDMQETDLRCPVCGYKIATVFPDRSGHIAIKCNKCKFSGVINLSYFRRIGDRLRTR